MIEGSKDPSYKECLMKPIVDNLENSVLSNDKVKERKLRWKAARFTMIEGVLFKKYFSRPLSRCV